MSVSARVLADAILDLGTKAQIPIDPMKLQKLVYVAHGWHLAFLNTPLISDAVEAWAYGPVVRDLYKEFKSFKASPIVGHAASNHELRALGPDSIEVLNSAWESYKDDSAIALSMLTHQPGSAWDTVRRYCEPWESPIIPNELIRDEFLRRQAAGTK